MKALKSNDLKKLKSPQSSKTLPQTLQEPSGEIIESIIIKGVFSDRSLNNRSDAYLLMDNQENLGLKYYMHKYFKGINDYNLEDSYIFSFNDDTLLGHLNGEKVNLIRTRDNKLVLRVYYQISDASRLILLDSKNKDLLNSEINVNNKDSNKMQKHFLVFENELKGLSNLALLNKDFESWLASHEIDMSNWKLVDADNFMKGNSFFYNKTQLEAHLHAGINSLEELGAALNGYFHEENNVKEAEAADEIKEEIEPEKEKSKKDAAAPKEKGKKEAKEPKQKEKDGTKGKKGEKADKGEIVEKAEKKNDKIDEKPSKQEKLTQLNCSYKVNYLFDLKDSQDVKKFAEDTVKINELIQSEIKKIRSGQTVQRKEIVENEKKTLEKSQQFYDKLMEYIDNVNN